MLARCLRRCPNINPALTYRVCWAVTTQTVDGEMSDAFPVKLLANRWYVLIVSQFY